MEKVRVIGSVSKGVPAGSSIEVILNVYPVLENLCFLQNGEDFQGVASAVQEPPN
jgi:hypothetical protein